MNSIAEIIDFAIENEKDAYHFYIKLAKKAIDTEMKKVFIQFAQEEAEHKERLLEIRGKGFFENNYEKIPDFFKEEYAITEDLNPEMTLTYKEALLIAIQKENASLKMYDMLAKLTKKEEIKSVFISLALEESRHKRRFEQEYENFIVNNN